MERSSRVRRKPRTRCRGYVWLSAEECAYRRPGLLPTNLQCQRGALQSFYWYLYRYRRHDYGPVWLHGHSAPDGTVRMSGSTRGAFIIFDSAELYSSPSLTPAPSGDGQGQGAILHSRTHQVASSSNAAFIGEALQVYCTGLVDGSVIPDGRNLVFWQGSRIRGAEL